MKTRRRRRQSRAYSVRLEAEQLAQLELHLVEQLRPRKKRGPEFCDFAQRFILWAHAERQKPSSLLAKASALRLYLTPRFRGRRLGELVDVDVMQLLGELAGKSPKTVNNVLSVLRRMLRLAVQLGELDQVPVRIEGLKVDRPPFDFYDFQSYEQLVAAAKLEAPAIGAMVLLAGDAGLRMGELLALEWGDVGRRELAVRRSEWQRFVTTPKGGRSRTVPLTVELQAQLELLVTGPKKKPVIGVPARVLVHADGRALTTEGIRNWLRRAQRRAGLPDHGRLHVLRHTFCSHLAMRGAAAVAVRDLAGHADLETTQRYMHLAPAERSRSIGLLDEGRRRNAGATTRESL